ncbi:MAG: trigger factor [Lachnospiraceae bacterium]|nr:trigger factor [Lachnospiraceae bacterium]MBQ4241301.1 trigger factor [Lachnospiraceae bacterium]MCR4785718.1 trigger factor [Lachnospiraceae bacterium]
MSVQVEKSEHSMAKLTIEIEADKLEGAIQKAYLKQRGRISIPGFRKGKAPRALIEKMYGVGVFYEDAANELINETYPEAVKESGEDIVSRPDIEVTQIEKGKPFIYTAEVALKPPVELGKYKGIKVEPVDTAVTDDEVEEEIKKELEKSARQIEVTDRAAKKDDNVLIDYSGSVDGVKFDGGTAEDQHLVLGSHSFIDGFEDQIEGHSIGDEFDVNVTFPEQYHEKSLAGKPAVFAVKLKGITEKQIPELDDDFVSDVSEFESVAEYKADIRQTLEDRKAAAARNKKEDEAVKALVEDSRVEIPQPMIDTEADDMIRNQDNRFRSQGLSLQQYLQYTGMTAEKYRDDVKEQAKLNIESRLVLEAVAEAEGIEIADEDIEKEIQTMADNYGMPVDSMKTLITENERKAISTDLKVRKAVDVIIENSKEDKTKKTVKKADDGDEVIEKKKVVKKTKAKKSDDKAAE